MQTAAKDGDLGTALRAYEELYRLLGDEYDMEPSLPTQTLVAEIKQGKFDTGSANETPTLMFAGQHDKQVSPDRVRELYADLAAPQKLFVDLACSSHNAMWEKNRLLMFKASLDWLTAGQVNGMKEGTLRLGY